MRKWGGRQPIVDMVKRVMELPKWRGLLVDLEERSGNVANVRTQLRLAAKKRGINVRTKTVGEGKLIVWRGKDRKVEKRLGRAKGKKVKEGMKNEDRGGS